MADTLKTLIRMANQIADFHRPYSHDEAVAGVHTHIKKFWTPQMIKDLAAAIDAGKADVRPSVTEAFDIFGNRRKGAVAAQVDPKELNEVIDDAG